MGKETTKISIDIEVEVKLAGWVKDHTLIAGPLEVSDDRLDRDGVRLFWLRREPGNLADSEGDVAAGVGGQVKEHTNDGWVAPWFIHRWTIGVGAERSRGRKDIRFAILKTGRFQNFIDQTSLREED